MKVHFKETDYGFDWGSVKVTRACSDEKKGWVVLLVKTPKEEIQVYVTKTGKVRISSESGEWKNENSV